MNLEPTGERMIIEHYQSSSQDRVIYLLHVATYEFAQKFTQAKRVLDFGCGSGYGSAEIAKTAKTVTAVDVADEAIAHARQSFPRDNLNFLVIDPAQPLPFADASFDVVLSFQVFEHVSDTSLYLSEIRRVLTQDGQLILVTPNRSTRLLPFQRPWNRWHVNEYNERQLSGMLAHHFDRVQIMGMSGKLEMIEIETRRCNRLKWMMLPLTLPFIPDQLRIAGLNFVHRIRGNRPAKPCESSFTSADVSIALHAAPSVNLVAVAS